MQKIIYSLWKPAAINAEDFRDKLLYALSPQLIDQQIRHLRVCVVDKDVAAASAYRIVSDSEPVDAVITLWVDSYLKQPKLESLIAEYVECLGGYLVWESEPLVGKEHFVDVGQRTPGMNEIVFLRKPERLEYDEWLDIWHNSHTQVAIETQSTFAYRQNVVIRPITQGAKHHDAIIEENFPETALSSRLGFYEAGSDKDLYKSREAQMVESCRRFIDFDNMDCIPMSEYIMKR